MILSGPGRVAVSVVYAILIGFSIYGCMQVRIDFKVTYFIGETASVYEYFQLNDKYFNSGTKTTTYVDNSSLDYTSLATQQQMLTYNEKLIECPDCTEKWNTVGTL